MAQQITENEIMSMIQEVWLTQLSDMLWPEFAKSDGGRPFCESYLNDETTESFRKRLSSAGIFLTCEMLDLTGYAEIRQDILGYVVGLRESLPGSIETQVILALAYWCLDAGKPASFQDPELEVAAEALYSLLGSGADMIIAQISER
jgi:hypothetical protein